MDLSVEQQEQRDKLVLECMALGYLINRTTEYAVFVELSGHVDSVSVRICRGKQIGYNDELAATEFNIEGKYENWDYNNPNYWLEMRRDMLRQIAESRSIPYEMMQREAHVFYTHHF